MTAERFVLDASVSLEWFLPGSQVSAAYANAVLAAIDSDQLVPVVPIASLDGGIRAACRAHKIDLLRVA